MAQFDIIAASTNAYKTCWQSRHYLMKLALAPFLVKVVCLVFASAFAKGGDTTAFLFFMLPSLFVEGWMLAHFVRYIQLGQTWPFRPTGNMEADLSVLAVRARGVLGGMIVFVLIGMALGLLTTLAQSYLGPYMTEDALKNPESIPTYLGVLCLIALAFLFWGFRLMWLFIPYALNNNGVGVYLYRLRGLGSSLHMIGVWILCLVPFILLLQLLAVLVAAPIGGLFGPSVAYFLMTILVAAVDTAKSLTTTAGITYGLREVFLREGAR